MVIFFFAERQRQISFCTGVELLSVASSGRLAHAASHALADRQLECGWYETSKWPHVYEVAASPTYTRNITIWCHSASCFFLECSNCQKNWNAVINSAGRRVSKCRERTSERVIEILTATGSFSVRKKRSKKKKPSSMIHPSLEIIWWIQCPAKRWNINTELFISWPLGFQY